MTEAKKLTFVAVGDINLNRDNPETTYAYTAQLLQAADITFGQLEASISDRPALQVHASSICCVPSTNVSGLSHAGFDVISFAGNHTLDDGVDALKDTIDILKKNNIGAIGTGINLFDDTALRLLPGPLDPPSFALKLNTKNVALAV